MDRSPAVRELRELVRYRAKLVMLRAGLKSQVQGVLTKEGVIASRHELWSKKGRQFLEEMDVAPSLIGPASTRCAAWSTPMTTRSRASGVEIAGWLDDDLGYQAVQAIKGRGSHPRRGLHRRDRRHRALPQSRQAVLLGRIDPKHRESGHQGHTRGITKQGSRLVRWAAIEAISRGRDTTVAELYARVKERRGTNVARVAAARKLLHLVYYGMRDGEIRCLAQTG